MPQRARAAAFGHGLHGGTKCQGNAPWGWKGDGVKDETRGAWFLDPAGMLLDPIRNQIKGKRLPQLKEQSRRRYISNVFLRDQLLAGTFPTVEGDPSRHNQTLWAASHSVSRT